MIDFQYLAEEFVKCYTDKSRVYMIQNYLKTYDATQRKEVPFQLFPRQQDLCRALGDANNVVTTKPRQAGITTTSGAFIACEMILAEKETPQTVLAIGNTLELAQLMLYKIRDFLLQFPLWMWGDEYLDSGYDITKPPESRNVIFSVCNGKEVRLRNGCKIVARSSGPDASRGVGGVTWLIFDEAAFIENGKDVYASALPTVSTGGHIIMISTPNGKDQLYYETCRKAKLKGTSGWNKFELVEMKWYQDPRYNKFLEWYRKNDKTGEIDIEPETYIDDKGNIEYNPAKWMQREKEGWKPRSDWYITMCQQFNNDEQKIAQELDVSFLGSASNVVAPEYIEMQQRLNVMEPDPTYKDPLSEDTWIWKRPIAGHRYLMSIDCSRGDAADRTALEIIDLDAVDENGKPCIEQVLEYHGKKTGDDVGEMAYYYGKMYGDAFTVVDCIGGTGDACILTMMRLGYKNLYYDDPTLKTYTIQREASSLGLTTDGKLPGFHSSSVRFQMLTNFAHMVKTNAIKIRSERVITELDTWIYKGDAGRIDHMDGCHDDTLTCLAMALFVMQFSLEKIRKAKEADATILSSWTTSASVKPTQPRNTSSISMAPTSNMPFYTNKTVSKNYNAPMGSCMWLLAGKR
jgi:hypothetical protein